MLISYRVLIFVWNFLYLNCQNFKFKALRRVISILLVLMLFALVEVQAQCDLVQEISFCDITIIDGDGDSEPDGIINLYNEYNNATGQSISLATGTWFDPDFSFALDDTTGDLYLWDLERTSTSRTDHQFVIYDPSCPSGVAVTLNIIVGPFSGSALPPGPNSVNIQVCDLVPDPYEACIDLSDMSADVDINLFETLQSIPSPHLNGTWEYNGSSPNFISLAPTGNLKVTIPYQSGPPLVDEETFEFTYRVSGIPPCNTTETVDVKVSVVRPPFSGFSTDRRICESEIINGSYDADLDLRDDEFLVYEDIEGVWLTGDPYAINAPIDGGDLPGDTYNQISSPTDSNVNIKAVYDQIIATDGIRFGCKRLDYSYSVEFRSSVCGAGAQSFVSFMIYEQLRPFQQSGGVPLEFCEDSAQGTLNLYDQLEFATEFDPSISQNVLFDYGADTWTDWEFISGPSDLGLKSNETPSDGSVSAEYSYLGTVDLSDAVPGSYVFRYTVFPLFNCVLDDLQVQRYRRSDCTFFSDNSGFCNWETALVNLVIHPKDYAGEDTSGLEFCEDDPLVSPSLDLFSLLTTNDVDTIVTTGTWRDAATGIPITNPYTLPEITDLETFNFIYETETTNSCTDAATLSFTVYESYDPGTSVVLDVCNSTPTLSLFDSLGGNPSPNGTWQFPNSSIFLNHDIVLDTNTAEPGTYTYTVMDNVNASSDVICPGGQSATVTVTFHEMPSAGVDGSYSVCSSDGIIDLSDYLDASADTGGSFVDLRTTGALTGSDLDVSQLNAGVYNFRYEIQGDASCALATSEIELTVIDVTVPTANNQTFCVSEGPTIASLEVEGGSDYNWYETANATNALPLGTVLTDGEDYFVAAVDTDGCESQRIGIIVTVLPVDHVDCDSCIKDGISVNNDGINDTFELCDLPVSFPNFELQIYNRYGTVVYKGNVNTPLFAGVSNVSLTIGKKLPSGIYFYVFDPQDGLTDAFQGNFYLSR